MKIYISNNITIKKVFCYEFNSILSESSGKERSKE